MLSVSIMDSVGSVGKCCFRFYCLTESKRGLSTHAIHKNLVEIWNEKAPGLSTVKRWIKDFLEGSRGSLEDLPKAGRPTSTRTNENIAAVRSLITQDPKFSVRCIEIEANINRETARMVLKNDLQMKKVCSTWIPHELSVQSKELRINSAKHIRSTISQLGENAYHSLAIEDESWFFFCPRGTKQENKVWIPKETACRPQIVRPNPMTVKKSLVLLAFTCDRKLSVRALPYGEKIDSEAFVDFVNRTGDLWRKLRQHPTALKDLHWQHDNARPHTARSTKAFFERRGVSLVFQAPYSPDLNICDRWLFRELKRQVRDKVFESHIELEDGLKSAFHQIPEHKFRHQMDKLFHYCQLVIDAGGEYVSDVY